MNRVKGSYFLKTLAFLLALLLTAAACGTVFAGVYAFEQHLTGADKSAFMQKIFSYAAEYTANRARAYFENALLASDDAENVYNKDYFRGEAELLASAFTRERCNAAFEIRDEAGNVVLKNYDLPEWAYRYERAFPYEIPDGAAPAGYDAWDEEEYSTVSGFDEPTALPPAENETVPEADTTVGAGTEQAADTTAVPTALSAGWRAPQAAPMETMDAPKTLTPTSLYEPTDTDKEDPTQLLSPEDVVGIYLGDQNEIAGEQFRYLFPKGELNNAILAYCRTDFESGQRVFCHQNDRYVTYCQDEFSVSDNGVVYYNEKESFLYSFLLDGGKDYGWEDTTAAPSDNAALYTVTVFVAKDLTAKDVYFYADKLGNFAYGFQSFMIPAVILFLLLAGALWVFLFAAAGYKKNAEAPVCGGLHKIPFDLFTVLTAGFVFLLGAACIAIYDDTDAPLWLLGMTGVPLLLSFILLYFESLTVRLRTKTLGGNLLAVRGLRLLKTGFAATKKLFRQLSDRIDILWKAGAYYLVSFIAVVLLLLFCNADAAVLVLYLVFKFIELPLLTLGILNFDLIAKGTKKLAQGETGTKIQSRILFGEFRKQAEQLNAIKDGIDLAVRERMQSESMKTELITNVSHDLKTPLTSIVNYVDLLKKEPIDNPKAVEYVDVIDRQAQRLKKLTADIVDASKAATGNVSMNLERTDLGMLLGQVDGEYADKLSAAGLSVVKDLPDAPVFITADGRLLWRVLDNLMHNVCKYAQPGTRVYLTLERDGGAAKTTLRNISAAPLNISPEALTERFVRGDASRNTEGSGLGLSISKSLTELMGGQFEIGIDGDLFKVTLRFPAL